MTITYHKTVTKHRTNFEFFQLSVEASSTPSENDVI